MRVDERQYDETDDERDRRLEELNDEVHPVLELVQHPDLEEEPAQAKRAHYPPTAE